MNKHDLLSVAEQQESRHLWEEALKTYQKVYAQTSDIALLEKMAWCASRATLYDSAIEYYSELVKHQPNTARWYYSVGYQYYTEKKWKQANEWFEKALKIYPDYFVVKYRLGYSLRQLCGSKLALTKDEFWKALTQFNECEALWETFDEEKRRKNVKIYAEVCYQKGKMLTERNKNEEAIACFKKAISLLKKDTEECQYQLSKTYVEMAQRTLPETYKKYYVTELHIDILLALDEIEKAHELLEEHIKYRKKDYLLRKLAEIHLAQNRYQEAFQNILLALKMNKNNHLNHFVMAKTFFAAGFFIKAKEEAKVASELKKKFYASSFKEAEQLCSQIEQRITELNYTKDDEHLLTQFFPKKEKQNRISGEILKYNAERGFGFIVAENENYFFHITSFSKKDQKDILIGKKVIFEEQITEKGKAASNIFFDLDQVKGLRSQNSQASRKNQLNHEKDLMITKSSLDGDSFTCNDCMLRKREDCIGGEKICSYFKASPKISKAKKENWPKNADATYIKTGIRY